MANRKKHRLDKKKTTGFSITVRVLEDFKDYCDLQKRASSNVVEELLIKYNQTMKDNGESN